MFRLMKYSVLMVFFLLATVLSAQAQVALPRIMPGAPRILNTRFPIEVGNTITPENPAALQWGGPSRFGGGEILGVSSHAVTELEGDISGRFVGFRLVGESIALAGDTTDVSLESNFGFPVDKSATTLAVSFRFPDSYAYGYSTTSSEQSGSDISGTLSVEFEKKLFGISLRMTDDWYIGAATGTEEATLIQPSSNQILERDVFMSGIGFRSTGAVIWRMEFSMNKYEAFQDPAGNLGSGHVLRQGVLEVAFWNLVFGYTSYNLTGTGTRKDETIDGFTLDFGYAPFSGLTITGRFERSIYEASGFEVAAEETNAIVVSLQF